MNSTLLKCLDYILLVTELTEIQRLKGEAVKQQSFELACDYREAETQLLNGQVYGLV